MPTVERATTDHPDDLGLGRRPRSRFVEAVLAGSVLVCTTDHPYEILRDLDPVLEDIERTEIGARPGGAETMSVTQPTTDGLDAALDALVAELEAGLTSEELGRRLAATPSLVEESTRPAPRLRRPAGDDLAQLAADVVSAVDDLAEPGWAVQLRPEPTAVGSARAPQSGAGTVAAAGTGGSVTDELQRTAAAAVVRQQARHVAPAAPGPSRRRRLTIVGGAVGAVVLVVVLASALSSNGTPSGHSAKGTYTPTYVAPGGAGGGANGSGTGARSTASRRGRAGRGGSSGRAAGAPGSAQNLPYVSDDPQGGSTFGFSAAGSAQSGAFTISSASSVSWAVDCPGTVSSQVVSITVSSADRPVLDLQVPLGQGDHQVGTGAVLPTGTYSLSASAPQSCTWSASGNSPNAPSTQTQPTDR